MKPFRAIYRRLDYDCTSEEEPEEVLIIKLLPTEIDRLETQVVFLRTDGTFYSDILSRFTNCQIPWPPH